MSRKSSTSQPRQVSSHNRQEKCEDTLEELQRDVEGLLRLQQFQTTLLAEIQQNLTAIRKQQS